MSNPSDPQPGVGGARPPSTPASAADQGLDAAESAGFGGITWADELEGEATTSPGQSAGPGRSGAGAPPPPGPNGSTASDDGDPPSGDDQEPTGEAGAISVEDLVGDLEQVAAERDRYLEASRRLQAEFENYRKAVAKREADALQRANESLVNSLLPVLDACDGALASGATDVEPVQAALVDVLAKQGLERIEDESAPFDPARHEAIMHEPDDGDGGQVVAEVLRPGYLWKGRVVRPAMVKVRG